MARGIIKNWWNHSVKIAAIWSICAVIFFGLFQMALRNSSSNSSRPTDSTGSAIANAEQRSILYTKLAKELDEKGAVFLKQGQTSQSLSLSDLFTLKDGTVTPVLKAADPPVRANVLHLSTEFSVPISEAVKNILLPYFEKAIWFQNSSMYHFSMFHASHHIAPVPATETEIEAEAHAVEAVSKSICPLRIVLDRIILTPTGVLLGCWQVVSGADPVTIRAKLKDALPRAPQKQLYNEAMLHTSFARLLGPPKKLSEEENKMSDLQIFYDLVKRLNKIAGLKATVSELWYVEEYDLLALALNGKMKIRKFNFGCSEA
ncbi:transmembrane protein [Perilla frutescens var. frutescens]|nr:transmembrane protein [Perilla frutescens var. frutescens]